MPDSIEFLLPEVKTSGKIDGLQFPDISDINFWKMYNNRIILLEEEIESWDYHIVKDIINFNKEDFGVPVEERKPIIILINSNGGLLDITLSICDAIKISKTPVYTVNMGMALSGACLIFLMGEKRYAATSSWAMCHSGSGGMQGNYSETKEQSKVWDTQVKAMGSLIVERTGMDQKVYNKNKNKDWYLNQEQQLEYNFATDKLEDFDILFE